MLDSWLTLSAIWPRCYCWCCCFHSGILYVRAYAAIRCSMNRRLSLASIHWRQRSRAAPSGESDTKPPCDRSTWMRTPAPVRCAQADPPPYSDCTPITASLPATQHCQHSWFFLHWQQTNRVVRAGPRSTDKLRTNLAATYCLVWLPSESRKVSPGLRRFVGTISMALSPQTSWRAEKPLNISQTPCAARERGKDGGGGGRGQIDKYCDGFSTKTI